MRFGSVFKGVIALIILALFAAGAASTLGIQTRTGDIVEISGDQDDMVFAAGGQVRLALTTPDDVYAVGANIEIAGIQADHLSLGGGDIVISDATVTDILSAGGNIMLVDGTVSDDVIAAAADLTIRTEFSIEGSAVLTGASVTLDGPIGGELKASGEAVRLNGEIDGPVVVRAKRLFIGPQAHIKADLSHHSDSIDIADGARIDGEVIVLQPQPGPNIEPFLRRASIMFALFGLLVLAGLIFLVIMTVIALPGLMNRSRHMLNERSLSTLGIGFLVSVTAPAVIAILFVTIFGIPLGVLIGIIFLALAPLAFAAIIYTIGMRGRSMMLQVNEADNPGWGARFVWTALAALVFLVIGLVPILGGVTWLLAYVFGLGAVASQVWIALSRDERALIAA